MTPLAADKVLQGFFRANEKESPSHCYQDVVHIILLHVPLFPAVSQLLTLQRGDSTPPQPLQDKKVFYIEERCPFSKMTKEND